MCFVFDIAGDGSVLLSVRLFEIGSVVSGCGSHVRGVGRFL